jgi:L-histidine Nalpha-methyltransferase / hercynylcysteine S-oxide synthase
MLLQKAGEEGGTRPPPGIVPPDWESLQQKWQQRQELESKQELTVILGPSQVEIGHNDYEADDLVALQSLNDDDHEFGWDNEHPKRKVSVAKFKVERKPISNGEYHHYWASLKDKKDMPASWVMKDGQIMVRDVVYRLSGIWRLMSLSRSGRYLAQCHYRLRKNGH